MKRWVAILAVWLLLSPAAAFGGVTKKRGPGSSSGAGIPGLNGSTGNDATLSYLYGLKEFSNVEHLKTQIYFDPYLGSDSGTGTYEDPYRSIEKMKAICTSYTRCTVKGQDRVFSPLTLVLDASTVGLDEAGALKKGQLIDGTWNTGASEGVVLDFFANDVTYILVIARTSGNDPVAADIITEDSGAAIAVTVSSVVNTINLSGGTTVDGSIDPDCEETDRICILIESEYPEHPFVIDGNRFGMQGNTTADACGLFCAGGAAGGGYLAVQNVKVQNIATDAFSNLPGASENGRLLTLNTTCKDIRNGSENRQNVAVETNNCFTTHGTGNRGAIVALNPFPIDHRSDSATGLGSPIAPTDTSKMILIGLGSVQVVAVGANASNPTSMTGGDIVIIGPDLVGDPTLHNTPISINPAGTRNNRVQMARVTGKDLVSGVTSGRVAYLGNEAGVGTNYIYLYEVTLSSPEACRGIQLVDPGATSFAEIVMRDIVSDVDMRNIWVENQTGDFFDNYSIDWQGIYDNTGSTFIEWDGALENARTLAQFQAFITSEGGDFAGTFLATNSTANANAQWGTDTVHLRCSSARECWEAGGATYTIDLKTIYGTDPEGSCIPADVVGTKICTLRLTPTHVGAR